MEVPEEKLEKSIILGNKLVNVINEDTSHDDPTVIINTLMRIIGIVLNNMDLEKNIHLKLAKSLSEVFFTLCVKVRESYNEDDGDNKNPFHD